MLIRSENFTKKTAYEQNNAGEKSTNLYYTTDQQAFHKFLHTWLVPTCQQFLNNAEGTDKLFWTV